MRRVVTKKNYRPVFFLLSRSKLDEYIFYGNGGHVRRATEANSTNHLLITFLIRTFSEVCQYCCLGGTLDENVNVERGEGFTHDMTWHPLIVFNVFHSHQMNASLIFVHTVNCNKKVMQLP